MPSATSPPVDEIFRALADPTRRRVVARLTRGAASVTALAEPFGMALPSFVQHLRVLEACGLVHSTKAGRVRTYTLTPQTLQRADAWMERQRSLWERRLDQVDAFVTHLHKEQT